MKETETPDTEMAATLFRSLADPNRLAIVKHLMLSGHRVANLVGHLGLAQSTVSAHVRGLRDSGLSAVRMRGRATFYSLAEPKLTTNLLAAADDLLVATGEVPVICEPEVKALQANTTTTTPTNISTMTSPATTITTGMATVIVTRTARRAGNALELHWA